MEKRAGGKGGELKGRSGESWREGVEEGGRGLDGEERGRGQVL